MLPIQHDMLTWNAQRQYNINTKAKNKRMEKLSSGYRINRASDDAAGLTISEKMRRQIRGLKKGTENAQHGVSWVQTGDGALGEVHDILHRMNELTIASLNDTYTPLDRANMEDEFEQLQGELDRISTTTLFNTLNIFAEHEPTYDQICGNIPWDHGQTHEILAGKNQLVIEYRDDAADSPKTLILEVPPGKYTTHELIDELDDAAGISGPIHMEMAGDGVCKLNLENGEIIDTISGGLSYLLWDTYSGGGYGALIGTTEFVRDTDTLKIVQGQNDYMEFTIEYFDGSGTDTVKIDLINDSLPAGTERRYTKAELMNIIDRAVPASSGLKTSHYGKSIMLSSDLGIVTGFKGNMFKIENTNPIYTSVFYDNIQEGHVWHDPASVVGGAVLTTDTRDKEHNRYYIDSTNNTLVLQPNLTTSPTTITIDTNTADGYTAAQMVEELNKKFKAAGLENEVKACLVRSNSREKFPDGTDPSSGAAVRESVGDDSVYFEGIEIRTVKEGPDSIVNIDKDASSAYDTLFTVKNFNSYGTTTDAVINNETRTDANAYAESSKDYSGNAIVTIKNDVNDKFVVTLRSRNVNGASDYNKSFTIDILAGGSRDMTAADIVSAINTEIGNNSELNGRIIAKVENDKVRILDAEDKTLDNINDSYLNWNTEISLSSSGSNTGYRAIFQKEYKYNVPQTASGKGSLTIDTAGKTLSGGMSVYINGKKEYFDFNGKTSLDDIVGEINKTTPIEFKDVTGHGNTTPKNFSTTGYGTTDVSYWSGGTAKGDSVPVQGSTELTANAPAELAIGPTLKSSMTIVEADPSNGIKGNNKITIALRKNGVDVKKTLELDAGTYNQDTLAEMLQKKIDDAFGTGMGGASVDVKGNQLVLTSILPEGQDGKDTSITAYAKGQEENTFFEYLNTVETAASCKSNLWLSNNIALQDGVNDIFKFSYTDSTGNHDVEIDVSDSAAGETISASDLLSRITTGLTNQKNTDGTDINVTASIVDNRLVLTTKEAGKGTYIGYTTGIVGSTDPNADAIFGGLSSATAAQIILDKNVQGSANFTGTKSFEFDLDGQKQKVEITAWSSAADLVNKLNAAFADHKDDSGQTAPIDVTASLVNGKLCLTKNTARSGSLHMSYATGGTVMADMFGYEPKPGVTVSSSGTSITITAGANDTISIPSGESGGLVAPKEATAYLSHNADSGFHSAKYSTVTSNALDANGVVLDRWNNDLQFTFKQGTKTTNVKIELTKSTGGPTSLDDIKDELQTKIDAALGNDAIEVSLDKNNRLVFVSKKPGAEYQFSGMQSNAYGKMGGGFFHHVMCGYTTKQNQLDDPEDINGEQRADDIFAQGRHDVVTELTKLKPGVSDTLILDLTYIPDADHDGTIDKDKQQTITLEMKLDPNMREEDFYDADKLKTMIQEKLNEAINSTEVQQKAAQLGIELHENVIEVDVGRHQTNVVGNKDSVSISFTMTKDPDIATPAEGYFYIDGIRGNAAYETFYYTLGELVPAYIIGTKNINDGVVLKDDDTDLSFVVDGKQYTLSNLAPGEYTAEEVVDMLTQEFKKQNIPLAAEITKGGYLKISHQRMGEHVIEKVTGSARNELFYLEHAQKETPKERYIQLSSQNNDNIELYSPKFSTSMLHINSICISGRKYSEKTLVRLKDALDTVSGMRSRFGALQNRLEHSIDNNQNKTENQQAAESRIRDADMAEEMVAYSSLNIVQQAGQAVLAQANQDKSSILSLLG